MKVPGDDEVADIELQLLLEGVWRRYHHDFRRYAAKHLRRRLQAALQHYRLPHLGELQHRLLHDPALFHDALRFFTLQVSEMFRDPPYWAALRREVMPRLQTWPSVTVWVAGCSAGEEAWSMAIVLAEAGLLDRATIHATDIEPGALERARSGLCPLDRMPENSRRYLEAGGTGSLSDHYTAAAHGALFARRLRDAVVFGDHSLATDSVFAEVQLVSCRNVLIYFDRGLQDRAVGLFADALVGGGFLGLGSRETLQFNAHAGAFEPLDRATRIYRKRLTSSTGSARRPA